MSAQDLIMGARVAHLRELKSEIARLNSVNARLNSENEALKAHFDLALLAAAELKSLPEGARLEIWDGWNLVLGAKKEARDLDELLAQARAKTAADPLRRVWIVMDGPDESVRNDGRIRLSYTGGTGLHRADRLVVDFVRMAAYLGLAAKIDVRTNDRDFRAKVAKAKEVVRT